MNKSDVVFMLFICVRILLLKLEMFYVGVMSAIWGSVLFGEFDDVCQGMCWLQDEGFVVVGVVEIIGDLQVVKGGNGLWFFVNQFVFGYVFFLIVENGGLWYFMQLNIFSQVFYLNNENGGLWQFGAGVDF